MASDNNPSARAVPGGNGYQFGAFKGVFTPSILTVLGVIMYLRLGWVVGQAGLAGALLIVAMGCAITFLTGLSLSALATNMRVKGGGAYYIISRSLGVEIGAGIGVPLYFAQALGIAFYISGFAESVVAVFPGVSVKLVAVVTLALLALLAYFSADLSLRFQYVVMALIFLSLISFFIGAAKADAFQPAIVVPETFQSWPFWKVFAVFFPAVTGIEAGLAMSGDLKNPARALPLGTLSAVLLGFVVYISIPLLLVFHGVDRGALANNPMIMQSVARWPALVVAGVWAASLSSAMGSLLGAPRTLQALSRDKVVFRFLGRGYGRGGDPRVATAISTIIAFAAIMLGDLNVIAPVLSMFFLTSYGFLNLSAGLEELISPVSWRPRFRVRAVYSILGFGGCVAVMLMINAGATIIACLSVLLICYAMKRRAIYVGWKDMRLAVMGSIVRMLLYKMARQKPDVRTWQPNILVLSGVPTQRWHLVELAALFSAGRGLMTVAAVISEKDSDSERVGKYRKSIEQYLERRGVEALACVYPCDDPMVGVRHLVMAYGLGPLSPNTIMIGDSKNVYLSSGFAAVVCAAYRAGKNVVVVKEDESPDGLEDSEQSEGAAIQRVDVWWSLHSMNISLMLALAVLTARNAGADAVVTLKMLVDNEDARVGAEAEIKEFLKKERLDLSLEIYVRGDKPVFEMIAGSSSDADLVFMGMRAPENEESPEDYSMYCGALINQISPLPMVALVLAGEDVDFAGLFASDSEL